jgi:hypothetical protein
MPKVQIAKSEWPIRIFLFAALIAWSSTSAPAQNYTAPSGYYPGCFHGDAFSGTLSAVDDSTKAITLTYVDTEHN